MTLVIYKEHRIEIIKEGKSAYSYSIWDEDDFLVANDFCELTKKEVIVDCQLTVDDYIKNPEDYQ